MHNIRVRGSFSIQIHIPYHCIIERKWILTRNSYPNSLTLSHHILKKNLTAKHRKLSLQLKRGTTWQGFK